MTPNTIFVQIASYRDPQLIPTIKDLIEKAAEPSLLNIVVCWQHGDEQELTNFDPFEYLSTENNLHRFTYRGAKILLLDYHYNASKGACWARNSIQQYYNGEKYTLQLDSHHRFVPNCDTVMIDSLEAVRHQSKKPALTAYLPFYDPENDPNGRCMVPWKMDFDRFIPEGAVFFMPSSIDDWQIRDKIPMRARFYSGHFTFADGSFAVEVQHDPDYFFHGEEISIAARAFTHGYDLYHPTTLIAWHEYTRKNRTKIWDDHTTPQKKKGKIELDWVERNNACHARNRALLGVDGTDMTSVDFGKYGLGTERTLRQYEEYAGLNFNKHAVQKATLDKKEPPNSSVYSTEEEWADLFVRSCDIKILFHKNEIKPVLADYDFWYVGIADKDGQEIARKDATAVDIKRYLENDFIEFRFVFLSDIKPVTFVVWPHSPTVGWTAKLEKPVLEY